MTLPTLFLDFTGRIGRLTYLAGMLALVAVATSVNYAGYTALGLSMGAERMAILTILALVLISDTWMAGAICAKRLQDAGWSGWHAAWIVGLGSAAPFLVEVARDAAALMVVAALSAHAVLLFTPGDAGPNAHGPAPGAPRPDGLGTLPLAG
jgi:uncharacterized membrane protein YhaH (DUF805 family)